MPNIVRSRPLGIFGREFGSLHEAMDRLFDEAFFRWPLDRWEEGTLPVDVSEHDGKLIVRASLPGFRKEDIDVQLNQGVLSIKAEHSEEVESEDEHFYRRERRYGSVSRRVALPGILADAQVEAELKDGVLTLTIPVPASARPKQIEIKSRS